MKRTSTWLIVFGVWLLSSTAVRAEPPAEAPLPEGPSGKALAWLAGHQGDDGSWGHGYTIATTGIACLAWMAGLDEPYAEERGHAVTKGLQYLLAQQKEGVFPQQGHTWIHGQGFATLALAEGYGRTLFCTSKPDLDLGVLKAALTKAVGVIAAHQSTSGGWWYVQGSPQLHEGSTTVCAVQALVAASNYGIDIDEAVLARGFEYLKRCQNPDGGFDYKLGPGTVSMKEGTAAGIATLALMRRFDYSVMTNGVDFLKRIGPSAISAERFPYYGHFYACMGLRLFGEEMGAEAMARKYIEAATKDVLGWQGEDGGWPIKGWMASQTKDPAYATAFAALLLEVPAARLSIFNRRPPALPDQSD